MSQENVEIVRQAFECVERRDWDRAASLYDPDVEQHGTVGGVEEGRVLRGPYEIRRSFESEDEIWAEHRMEPEKFIDFGDRVVVLIREYQRGKTSGIETEVETAVIMDLRDGRIVRAQGYMDRAAALRAAGLSEQEAHADS
jgi:ketosteroid isomerase-like protein